MGLLYRNLSFTVSGLDTWYKGILYLDKKITHILAVSSDNDRVGNAFGMVFSVSNGYEQVIEEQPISLIYGTGDSSNALMGEQLFPLSGKEGLANKDGFLEVKVKYSVQAPGIEFQPPYYGAVNESLPADPITNPVIFKYPFQVNFRFQCRI